MSPEASATVSSTPTAKAPAAKKVAHKAKKVAKKVPAAAEKPEKAKKDGLRKPQVRILQCLAKAKKPLSRAAVAEKSPVDVAGCVEWIGSSDPDTRRANDEKHFPSLVTLGFVREANPSEQDQDVSGTQYVITAKGKAAAEKIKD